MRTVELNFQIGNSEILTLHEKASKLLDSLDGQKILREISAFDALSHSGSGKRWISPLNGKEEYSTASKKFADSDRFGSS